MVDTSINLEKDAQIELLDQVIDQLIDLPYPDVLKRLVGYLKRNESLLLFDHDNPLIFNMYDAVFLKSQLATFDEETLKYLPFSEKLSVFLHRMLREGFQSSDMEVRGILEKFVTIIYLFKAVDEFKLLVEPEDPFEDPLPSNLKHFHPKHLEMCRASDGSPGLAFNFSIKSELIHPFLVQSFNPKEYFKEDLKLVKLLFQYTPEQFRSNDNSVTEVATDWFRDVLTSRSYKEGTGVCSPVCCLISVSGEHGQSIGFLEGLGVSSVSFAAIATVVVAANQHLINGLLYSSNLSIEMRKELLRTRKLFLEIIPQSEIYQRYIKNLLKSSGVTNDWSSFGISGSLDVLIMYENEEHNYKKPLIGIEFKRNIARDFWHYECTKKMNQSMLRVIIQCLKYVSVLELDTVILADVIQSYAIEFDEHDLNKETYKILSDKVLMERIEKQELSQEEIDTLRINFVIKIVNLDNHNSGLYNMRGAFACLLVRKLLEACEIVSGDPTKKSTIITQLNQAEKQKQRDNDESKNFESINKVWSEISGALSQPTTDDTDLQTKATQTTTSQPVISAIRRPYAERLELSRILSWDIFGPAVTKSELLFTIGANAKNSTKYFKNQLEVITLSKEEGLKLINGAVTADNRRSLAIGDRLVFEGLGLCSQYGPETYYLNKVRSLFVLNANAQLDCETSSSASLISKLLGSLFDDNMDVAEDPEMSNDIILLEFIDLFKVVNLVEDDKVFFESLLDGTCPRELMESKILELTGDIDEQKQFYDSELMHDPKDLELFRSFLNHTYPQGQDGLVYKTMRELCCRFLYNFIHKKLFSYSKIVGYNRRIMDMSGVESEYLPKRSNSNIEIPFKVLKSGLVVLSSETNDQILAGFGVIYRYKNSFSNTGDHGIFTRPEPCNDDFPINALFSKLNLEDQNNDSLEDQDKDSSINLSDVEKLVVHKKDLETNLEPNIAKVLDRLADCELVFSPDSISPEDFNYIPYNSKVYSDQPSSNKTSIINSRVYISSSDTLMKLSIARRHQDKSKLINEYSSELSSNVQELIQLYETRNLNN